MGIRTKYFGASFEAGLEAGLEGLKAMEIGENNVTKKVPVLVLKTYEKAGAKMGLPSRDTSCLKSATPNRHPSAKSSGRMGTHFV